MSAYITDLPAFSSLAPCAAAAVSNEVQQLTYNDCPPEATALQSCACSKDQNSGAVQSSISTDVGLNCGSTATEDVTSASQVFNIYCGSPAPSTTAAAHSSTINQYITDFNAYSQLAPCAAEALSGAVQDLTYDLCPPAASALISCACKKDQNSLRVSESINTAIGNNCGTTHTADLTSAQAVFAAYCRLENGTSSFPTPSPLPGLISYYITDLPQYSSLAVCAQDALSGDVQQQTYSICNAAPLSLVSCVCVKDQNSQSIASGLVTDVEENCGTTATEDISSALEVLAYYCSAGKGLVTPAGVSASVTPSGSAGNGFSSSGSGSFPTQTSASSSLGSSPSSGTPSGSSSAGSSSSSSTGAIVGGVVGGVAGLAIIALVIWWFARRHRHRKPLPPPEVLDNTGKDDQGNFHKPELDATAATTTPTPVKRKAVAITSPDSGVPTPRQDVEADERVGRNTNVQEGRYQLPTEPSFNRDVYEVPDTHQEYELHSSHLSQVYELPSAYEYERVGQNQH